jgi:subtilisin family serine protease
MFPSPQAGRWSVIGVFLFFTLSVGGQVTTSSPEEPTYFIYHHAERPLTLDPTVVAVKLSAETIGHFKANIARPSLASAGLNTDAAEEHAPGWFLIPRAATASNQSSAPSISQRVSNAQDIHSSIRQLAQSGDPTIEFVSPVFRDDKGGAIIVTRRLLVGFDPKLSSEQRNALRNSIDPNAAEEMQEFPRADEARWQLTSTDGFDVLKRANDLARADGVAYAEPDMMFTGYSNLVPTDPSFSQSWGLQNTGQSGGVAGFDLGAPAAWNVTTGNSNIIVLVMDSGVQQDHPDINQVSGRDFTSDSPSNPNGGPFGPNDNHGTAVAGCISEQMNNGIGTTGIAPGVRVASARCVYKVKADGSWTAQYSWFADALYWGQSIGARVSNNSNGFNSPSSEVESAYANTRANGMIHFASAGNEGRDLPSYPASLWSVNSIGAIDRSGVRANFSNSGAKFMAPGKDIYTTDRTGNSGYAGGDYVWVDGTSFASPYVAGVAALILSQNPTLTPDQVENLIATTATDMGTPGYDGVYGYGLVNAGRAMVNIPSTADLAWQSFASTHGTFQPGDSIDLQYGYIDNSDTAASNFTVSFYLSADRTITSEDTLIGTYSSPGLAPHASLNPASTVTIPMIGSGQYYVGAILNFPDANAANNLVCDITPINIQSPFIGNLVPSEFNSFGYLSQPLETSINVGGPDSNSFRTIDGIRVRWAAVWQAQQPTTADFQTNLYVDGVLQTSWTTAASMQPNQPHVVQDFYLGKLPQGQHQITITVDSTNAIAETNENDNSYTKTITVTKAAKKKKRGHR